jgi:diguanylate cyclase (GGDEF)-like protein/PAS domain S-box-containing protein
LHELAVAASGVLDPEALAKMAVDQACALLGMEGAALYWWASRTGELHALADNRRHQAQAPRSLKSGQGVAGAAFQRVEPIVIEDYPTWAGAVSWALANQVQSGIGVPLVARGRAVGAMAVLTHTRRRFTPEDVQLLSLLAAQVAPSVEAARLDADLGASEQRFQSLYGTIACGVLVMNAPGVILQANPTAEQILGLSLNDLRGKRPEELWRAFREDGSELASTELPGPAVLRSRQAQRGFTMKIRRPNGHERWLQIDSIPVIGPDAQAVQVVSSFLDVTERKQVEEALRQSEQRFRAVFHRAAIGIARIDLEGRIIEANPTFHRMLGYELDQVAQQPITKFIHPAHTPNGKLRELVELAEGKRDEVQQELRYLHSKGGVVWGNSIVSLVRGPSNEPLFIIGMVEDITARKAQEAALEHQALHDVLTDLPNRTLLYDRLQQAILASKREQLPMALLMMDLDRFKEINDSLGHHGGDSVLRQVALRLQTQLRESETIARLGGDEFAIILPGVRDEAAAGLTAGRLLQALFRPFSVEGEKLAITASIGIVFFPKDGEDADTLLRRADTAMYVAKRANSGSAFYTAEHDTHSPSRLSLTFELRHAIEQGQLVLRYQPALQCRTGAVAGMEALAYWQHPHHGLLGPDRFISLAEQTGLIRPLGYWALETAVRQSQTWRRDGMTFRMALNLSMRNLQDPELLERLGRILKTHDVPADQLTIEITESMLRADAEEMLKILSPLRAMRVRVAIDDFGTGFSSLANLQRLPVDEVKIEKSFVVEMAHRKNDSLIVQTTIDLAHKLGLVVVAQGVEDQAAWDMLVAAGCDLAQGYYLSRPLPAEEVARWYLGRTPRAA